LAITGCLQVICLCLFKEIGSHSIPRIILCLALPSLIPKRLVHDIRIYSIYICNLIFLSDIKINDEGFSVIYFFVSFLGM